MLIMELSKQRNETKQNEKGEVTGGSNIISRLTLFCTFLCKSMTIFRFFFFWVSIDLVCVSIRLHNTVRCFSTS